MDDFGGFYHPYFWNHQFLVTTNGPQIFVCHAIAKDELPTGHRLVLPDDVATAETPPVQRRFSGKGYEAITRGVVLGGLDTFQGTTLPETNIAPENPIFPCKYHQNGGFSMAMLVSGRVTLTQPMANRLKLLGITNI